MVHTGSAFLDGNLPSLEAVPVPIISLSAGAIIVVPLSRPKDALGDVAPLLAAKAVSAAGVGGDEFRRQMTEDRGQ